MFFNWLSKIKNWFKPASPAYFSWNSVKDFDKFDRVLRSKFGEPARNRIKHYPETDLDWLSELYPKNLNCSDNERIKKLVELFSENFKGVVLYHNCCPIDVDNYYKYGFIPLDKDHAKSIIDQIIDERLGAKETQYIYNKFEKAWRELENLNYLERYHVHFYADRSKAMNFSEHHENFLKGGEFIRSLIGFLRSDVKQKFCELYYSQASSTIFEIKVPVNYMEDNMPRFIRMVLMKWAGVCLDSLSHDEIKYTGGMDFSRIPADYISDHFHPQKMIVNHPFCNKCKKKL